MVTLKYRVEFFTREGQQWFREFEDDGSAKEIGPFESWGAAKFYRMRTTMKPRVEIEGST